MFEWLSWLGQLSHSKIVALLLFFSAYCGIIIYLLTNKQRSQRLESYKYIPFQTDDDERHN